IIAGLAVGMYSTFWHMLFICICVIVSFFVMCGATNGGMGLFGISLAAVVMLSTTGLTVAFEDYGPNSDNAG
ncbi:sodium/proton-translocating pyrophosphatase, partial [Phascolarctobacterium faecium]|uniref:sodium/proton-translocating pyrophosphatase n=1 Tax=Phascolarctobacterium faecium TaxID=33025 RepID=UPI00210A7669